jgi:hypothetical protein
MGEQLEGSYGGPALSPCTLKRWLTVGKKRRQMYLNKAEENGR